MFNPRLEMKGVVFIMVLIFGLSASSDASDVREPAVAGSWYPATENALKEQVNTMLNRAENPGIKGRVIGLVAPHAGYVYSGQVAASAYKILENMEFDRVILFGNAHRVGFNGAAIDNSSHYRSPLGDIPVDSAFIEDLLQGVEDVRKDIRPHLPEHSLEAQIPFLQRTLKPGFKIVPILFGHHSDRALDTLCARIARLSKGKSVLLIASTDLTHFPGYEDSCRIDKKLLTAIAAMDIGEMDRIEREEMSKGTRNLDCVICGGTATRAVINISRSLGADRGVVLAQANSGDASFGDRKRVVGYGAVAFYHSETLETTPTGNETSRTGKYSISEQKYLLGLSRHILETYVREGVTPKMDHIPEGFKENRGAFVTLKIQGHLRGCIGYIMPDFPCIEAIIENTVSACSRDPRFPPVTEKDLENIDIEISVLTPPARVDSAEDIIVGRHGIVLKKGYHRSVFLPQVAPEQGWDRETTLRHLSRKAGLGPEDWRKNTQFEVFEAQVFGENELGRQTFTRDIQ